MDSQPTYEELSARLKRQEEAFRAATERMEILYAENMAGRIEVEQRNQELKEERKKLESVNAELQKARRAADDANRLKGDFLANMSHEIRTPMNAIIGLTRLCLQTEPTDKQRNYLNKISLAANSLLGIINDILDFSKIEAGKLSIESVEFSLEGVLENLANVVSLKAQEKGLELVFSADSEVPLVLVGDPLRLGQVLLNLANNAVKFTQSGHIVVAVRKIHEDAERITLQFSVKDTGIGITKEQLSRLFQEFTQADASTTRKYGGTGLGLTISKRLVEMMGGKIQVESVAGGGSTFSFTFVTRAGAGCRRRRHETQQDFSSLRVLVVDDNQVAREILSHELESFSFQVSVASSGAEALTQVERASKENNPFQIVFMDWKMPEMDGVEATKRIKTHPNLPHKPIVVMLTNYAREDVVKSAEAAKVDAFLIKPVTPSLLVDTIMSALGKDVAHPRVILSQTAVVVPAQLRGAHILLAEDNEINQEIAKEFLEAAGFVVTIANNGREALRLVETKPFGLVLMDVQMPVMDGYTASREIRSLASESRKIPIVAMTANVMEGDKEKCLQAGMNDHVAKPIDPKNLFDAITRWIMPPAQPELTVRPAPADRVEQAEDLSLPDLPGIDMKAGLARVLGNKKTYRKMLVKFYDGYADAAVDLRTSLVKKDWESAQRAAHTLKGLAGNIGAQALFNSTAILEKALRDDKHEQAATLVDACCADMASVISALSVLVSAKQDGAAAEAKSAGGSPALDTEKTAGLIAELTRYLKNDDAEATRVLESLEESVDIPELKQDIRELGACIGKFDFEEALSIADRIAKTLKLPVKG